MRLRLLATTDLHMQLTGFDYYADRRERSGGLTRIAPLIHTARTEPGVDLSLLLDNGDSIQGTQMGDIAAKRPEAPHPLMRAFTYLGYDALGLGNHDFNFGLEVLDRVLEQAPCPVVCSNAHRLDGTAPWQRMAILDREVRKASVATRLRIGVLAALPPQTMEWDAHILAGRMRVEGIVDAARETVSRLKAEGCDLIVALAHSGLAEAVAAPDQENAVIPLAALEGIDAIVAGHTHLRLPSHGPSSCPDRRVSEALIRGTPVVMPGHHGSHLGIIDLELQQGTDGRWRVDQANASLRPTDDCEDAVLTHLLAADHAATRAAANQPAGLAQEPMHSYFTFVAPDRGLAKVAAAQAAALRPFLESTALAELPVLSSVSPLKAGGRAGPDHYTDVPAGPLSMRHVADLHMFPNELRALVLTGAELREWLEMAAGVFLTPAPAGACDMLLDTSVPGHNFDSLYGLTYEINPSAPARYDTGGHLIAEENRRIGSLHHNGAPVNDRQKFVVVLNNYRTNGGGHFLMLKRGQPIPLPSLRIQSALHDYLSGRLPDDPLEQAPHPWRLAPMPGQSAILRTGPRARDHLDELAGRDVTDLGLDDEGFLCLRLGL
ncbi:5'-nucleotidase C-terminal domain-containing protein [Ruegeria alba]|nr:5'-nucleotidase C-terminal domain-containing protein [Ruegeria alba]